MSGFSRHQVFPNDFPALLKPEDSAQYLSSAPAAVPAATAGTTTTAPSANLFSLSPTFGSCKVLTYSPRHDLTLALMSVLEIREVVRCWRDVYVNEGEEIRKGHRSVGGVGAEKDDGCVNIFEVSPARCPRTCNLEILIRDLLSDSQNRGSMMGASAPHPHGQVWSTSL